MTKLTFISRTEAAETLAKQLEKYKNRSIVYALPRGGVETGLVIASQLNIPLQLIIARKIGHPSNPEYAIGAVTEHGQAIWNKAEFNLIDRHYLDKAEAEQRVEAKRRRLTYLSDRKQLDPKNKIVILSDDGIATGLTMQAAILALKKRDPAELIVAVPVAPADSIKQLKKLVDKVIVLVPADKFLGAVGAHYQNFDQLSDDDVLKLLEQAA